MLKAGHLRKKGKYYYYSFDFNGKKFSDLTTKCTSERKAEARANEIYDEYISREEVTGETIKEFAISYLRRYEEMVENGSRALGTLEEIRHVLLNHFIKFIGSERKLKSVTTIEIEDYYLKKQRKLSNNTLAKHHKIIKKFFAKAVKAKLIDENPAENADHPTAKKSKVGKALTPDETLSYVDYLLKNVPVNNSYGFFTIAALLAIFGGLRREEVLGVQWQDLDDNTLNIKRAIVVVNGKIIIKGVKTEESERKVILPDFLLDLLAQWETHCKMMKLKHGKLYDGNFIVCDDLGHFIKPDRITRNNTKYLKEAGLPSVRFHDLRHTHASLLFNLGVDIHEVSDRLGHSNINTTSTIYTHIFKNRKEKTAEILDRFAK